MPVGPGREQAQRLAAGELARPVYAAGRPSLLDRGLAWLQDRLSALLPDSAGGLLASPVVQAVVVVVLVVVLALALRLAGQVVARRRRPVPAEVFVGEQRRSAADHRARADELAARGEWDGCVAERFRAVVRSVEERSLLDERPGRTAAEVAEELADLLPAAAGAVRDGARTFGDVVYGSAHAGAADDARLRALDAQVAAARAAV